MKCFWKIPAKKTVCNLSDFIFFIPAWLIWSCAFLCVFLIFRRTLLCFDLHPLSLVQSLGTTRKCLALASVLPSGIYIYIYWYDPPEFSLLRAGHSQLSQPLFVWRMLQSLSHLHGPLLDLLQYVPVWFILGSPALDPKFWMVSELSSFLCGYLCNLDWSYCYFLLLRRDLHGFHFYLSKKRFEFLFLIFQLLGYDFSRVLKVWF